MFHLFCCPASQDLNSLVKKLEARVAALELANSGSTSSTSTSAAPAEPAKKEDSDSDFDMFDDVSNA